MTSVHTITVTQVPNTDQGLPEDQLVYDVLYTVECPGTCTLYYLCRVCEKEGYEATEEEDENGEYNRHGATHERQEGEWCTLAKECWATADGCQEAISEAAEEAGVGVHQMDLDYYGDGQWVALVIDPGMPGQEALPITEGQR